MPREATLPDDNTHRRKPTRLRGYDYSHSGIYFVTICTARHAFRFGNVNDGKMLPNTAGRIVQSVWNELPAHYPGLQLDAFVVMPNHVHGIIVLHSAAPKFAMVRAGLKPAQSDTTFTGLVGAGSPRPPSPVHSSVAKSGAVTAPLPAPLGQIVAYFKYESTKRINTMQGVAGKRLWQRNYYEHVIRRGDSLDRIRRYIADNPARWSFDRENPHAVNPEPPDAPWSRP